MLFCQLFNSLGELGFSVIDEKENSSGEMKRMLYLLWLMLQPMNVPYAWSLFAFAVLQSLLMPNTRNRQSSRVMQIVANFSDEEFMNLFFMAFLIPSGRIIKLLINLCLAIWALMHVCVMADSQLKSNPNTLGLSALKGAIDYVNLRRIEFSLIKNKIEVFLALIALPSVFMAQAALIFPIMYFQYIRVKYVSNHIMK